jgi:succinate dehydrogenase / fumarate reductase cytochrome b subunit
MAIKKQQFYLRRLHSLTGLLIGLFLFNHFLTNSFVFGPDGKEAFNHKVHFIHSIPFLFAVEMGMVFLPFLFHMVYGLMIMWKGESNTADYGYGRNWMYAVQRWTAWILVGFILWHLLEWRFFFKNSVPAYDGKGEFQLGGLFYDALRSQFSKPWYVALYLLGVGAAIVHFCNGLCTFSMSWGVTVGPESQKKFIPVAIGIGVIYALLIGKAFLGLLAPVTQKFPESKKVAMAIPSSNLYF